MDGRREEEIFEEDDEEDDDYFPSDTEAEKDENSDGDESDECPPEQTTFDSTENEAKKMNETEIKQKVDELWADLCKGSSHSKPKESIPEDTVQKQTPSMKAVKNPIKTVRVYEFAGEEVKVEEDVNDQKVDDDKTKGGQKQEENPLPAKRSSSGLGNLLATINKKQKLSTLSKTKIDWQSFKKSEGFESELEQHRRSKDSFVERQAFLQRSDLREFENEKSIRDKQRLSK